MAVRLRLKRMGRRHRPFYRVAAMEARTQRDGRVIEELGHYDPLAKNGAGDLVLNKERIEHWLSVGAQPTDTVKQLIERHRKTASGA